jgi:hypothetical protein
MAFNILYTLQIAERVQEITRQHYEPGRQDKNYRAVWQYHVLPKYHIRYKTYLKYLKIDVEEEKQKLKPD